MWRCAKAMDTKSLIIHVATTLFQQKGYLGVGLNEILKACQISKGALYHHFPNGKEELLIVCLQTMNDAITKDIEDIFRSHATTLEATQAMIQKLIVDFERDGVIIGHTISSIVSEMAMLSESVRGACAQVYTNIQAIYIRKLLADGFSDETARSLALTITASIEGGMMLCLTQQSSKPFLMISSTLPNLLKEITISE